MTFASTEPGGNKGRHHHLSWSSSRWTGFYVNIFYNWASVSWFGNLAIFIILTMMLEAIVSSWVKTWCSFWFSIIKNFFLPLDHNQECFERTACRLGEYAKDIPGESESWSESFLLGGRYWKSKSELYSGRKWKAKTYSLIIFPGKDILFVVLDRFFPSSWVKSLDISREVILHLHHHHHHMTM